MESGHPARYAPATKLAQFFYNHRISQRRSRSEKPEYEYNQDLVQAFLMAQGVKKPKTVEPPYLSFKPADAKKVKQKFLKKNRIPATKKLVFVHAGHGGSASNLSVLQYAELIKFLSSSKQRHFVLTAGPGEEGHAHRLSKMLGKIPHAVYLSEEGLGAFAKHLQFAEVFISGSTGPLHLAAALGCAHCCVLSAPPFLHGPALADGEPAERAAGFQPPATPRKRDMSRIDIRAAAADIAEASALGDSMPLIYRLPPVRACSPACSRLWYCWRSSPWRSSWAAAIFLVILGWRWWHGHRVLSQVLVAATAAGEQPPAGPGGGVTLEGEYTVAKPDKRRMDGGR